MNSNLQKIRKGQLNRYEEIIKYLKQDNGYWLNNDKWDLIKNFFVGEKVHDIRYIDFSNFKNTLLKNEFKYYIIFNFKENKLSIKYLVSLACNFKHLSNFCNKYYYNIRSFSDVEYDRFYKKWIYYLSGLGIKYGNEKANNYKTINILFVIKFIGKFYDDREEIEKDIWDARNIKGVKIRATQSSANNKLNFTSIPEYYREAVKRYFVTIITKKSFSLCATILTYLNYFFRSFYSRGYNNGFIEKLERKDMEEYIFHLMNYMQGKGKQHAGHYISYVRMFLEYMQLAQYKEAPKKDVSFLIFKDDMPRNSSWNNKNIKAKFIPEPIVKQLDSNIRYLSRPEYIPVYILLRETGWRGTDILNLRYNNCLEQIWNSKEKQYNYYLCGEITKTGIAELKIPIRDKVAEMVRKIINKAKELSTDENNPKKYLFNTYEGKLKGTPLPKYTFKYSIELLIKEKDIRDINGELYHFRMHSLRHTRAKEYVEQGMGISVIQQILGHTSLQMTVHYATVDENLLYEKWKATEDLELFKVNVETHKLEHVDLNTDEGKELIRYEYVKKNLDAVKVPFGVCFKPSKLPCKQQMNHCLNCASFCTTIDNIPEYEEEIEHVKKQIDISERCGRELWAEKNKEYLNLLEQTLNNIREHKLIHKNGDSREEV
ncbi:tyrosine recombinase XerC [Clostridium saccharobutylicum]|uniref:tyrosine-type recombinase/integrase n=1 Tax=Clostridium saccharobutylicum TaxID=169679 RepID=UPI000983FFAF|nr:tyrosine-type recombinase/integrase [Clostridium saccharobutylicum]AQS10543.1 tyrosine recombinase XerC [Clostridium saccharobutylicum]MBC2438432.1 tyrosine-type recombinase/integrase [Clostridium saccharobutylicum]NSB90851.1 integrase [Clostridium saccharobutylicum]NYC31497.1 integrase [Clostridium saccharobutylicum]OOM18436.1 tyrosine recombinase XerC [Clostridium saccharobutylicum]